MTKLMMAVVEQHIPTRWEYHDEGWEYDDHTHIYSHIPTIHIYKDNYHHLEGDQTRQVEPL